MNFISLFFILLFGHCLADTALQSSTMAKAKKRTPLSEEDKNKNYAPWWMWLTHHSVIHGGVIWLFTGRIYLGIIETALHWIIDFFKSENKYNPYVDQTLHLLCKVIYCLLILGGI